MRQVRLGRSRRTQAKRAQPSERRRLPQRWRVARRGTAPEGGGKVGGASGSDGVVSDVEVGQTWHAVEVVGEMQRTGWTDLVVPGGMRDADV